MLNITHIRLECVKKVLFSPEPFLHFVTLKPQTSECILMGFDVTDKHKLVYDWGEKDKHCFYSSLFA